MMTTFPYKREQVLSTTQRHDHGEYTCQVNNTGGTASIRTQLVVTEPITVHVSTAATLPILKTIANIYTCVLYEGCSHNTLHFADRTWKCPDNSRWKTAVTVCNIWRTRRQDQLV